jgi:hypothetical protein
MGRRAAGGRAAAAAIAIGQEGPVVIAAIECHQAQPDQQESKSSHRLSPQGTFSSIGEPSFLPEWNNFAGKRIFRAAPVQPFHEEKNFFL